MASLAKVIGGTLTRFVPMLVVVMAILAFLVEGSLAALAPLAVSGPAERLLQYTPTSQTL